MTVFIAGGMDADIQSRLDRVTRIWLAPGGPVADPERMPGLTSGVLPWRGSDARRTSPGVPVCSQCRGVGRASLRSSLLDT